MSTPQPAGTHGDDGTARDQRGACQPPWLVVRRRRPGDAVAVGQQVDQVERRERGRERQQTSTTSHTAQTLANMSSRTARVQVRC